MMQSHSMPIIHGRYGFQKEGRDLEPVVTTAMALSRQDVNQL
jgi:hypothetical protein